MTDIFISYAREDVQTASHLATRLDAEGWTVFWDQSLRAGEKWPDVLETAVKAARCIVVLWSEASTSSTNYMVREEATIGRERGVLVPARLDSAKLPFGFSQFQAANLAGWNGTTDSEGLTDLIRAITDLIGNRKSVTMWPLDLAIVIGRPKRWGDIGAAINLNCKFVNALQRTVAIRWLEASAAGPNGRSYYFVWKLLYDRAEGGTEHVRRIDRTARIDVPAGSVTTGVQLQAPSLSDEIAWPSGGYTFQLRGWADRERDREPANLRTEFDVSVTDYAAQQADWLITANDATWQILKASDDAIGIPTNIGKVRVGLLAG